MCCLRSQNMKAMRLKCTKTWRLNFTQHNQQFLWGLFLQKEADPKKTVHSEVCGLSVDKPFVVYKKKGTLLLPKWIQLDWLTALIARCVMSVNDILNLPVNSVSDGSSLIVLESKVLVRLWVDWSPVLLIRVWVWILIVRGVSIPFGLTQVVHWIMQGWHEVGVVLIYHSSYILPTLQCFTF